MISEVRRSFPLQLPQLSVLRTTTSVYNNYYTIEECCSFMLLKQANGRQLRGKGT